MSPGSGTQMIGHRIMERMYRREPVFSFEFFPPKTEKGEAALFESIRLLAPLKPDYVSVTYGAGGSTREKTHRWVCSIQEEFNIHAMAHLTCMGHTHEEIRNLLIQYAASGITNILALRGDPPKSDADWKLVENGPEHAVELVKMARSAGVFSVGVAGFPEKHPESATMEDELKYLRQKVDAGADFVITQLFFDNDEYFAYVDQARKIGVTIPIIPGIMPITMPGQVTRFRELSGCKIPASLEAHISECGEDESQVQEIGLAYCAAQCADLLRRGAPGIHFYTLNKSRACHTIYSALRALGFWDRSEL